MKKILFFLCSFILIFNVNAKTITCNGDYNANINLDVTTIDIGEKATITINGLSEKNFDYQVKYSVVSGAESINLKKTNKVATITGVKSGKSKISVEVTFLDGGDSKGVCKGEANITVLSQDAKLKSLNIDAVDLKNEFSPDKYEYSLTVPYEVEKINITAAPNDSKSEVTGTGYRYLNDGLNTYLIQVIAESGDKAVYKLEINRTQAGSDTTLKNLVVNGLELTPKFSATTHEYKIDVKSDIDKINVLGEATDATSAVTGVGDYNLITGENIINIKVTAQNGNTETYKIIVNKDKGISQLVSLKVSKYKFDQKFNRNTYNYTLKVYDDIESLKIVAEATEGDLIEIEGNEKLQYGKNDIFIKVYGENKTTSTYKITVEKVKTAEIIKEISNNKSTLLKILLVIFVIATLATAVLISIFVYRNYKRPTNKKIKSNVKKLQNKNKAKNKKKVK